MNTCRLGDTLCESLRLLAFFDAAMTTCISGVTPATATLTFTFTNTSIYADCCTIAKSRYVCRVSISAGVTELTIRHLRQHCRQPGAATSVTYLMLVADK